MRVALGRPDVAVAQYLGDDDDVDAGVCHAGGRRVAQVMKAEVFDLRRPARQPEGPLDVNELPAGELPCLLFRQSILTTACDAIGICYLIHVSNSSKQLQNLSSL